MRSARRLDLALLFCAFSAAGIADAATQVTTTAINETWGFRHPASSRGKILWFDDNQDIFLYDGTSNVPLQPKGSLQNVADFFFGLGSGATGNEVIAAWRRGDVEFWVSVNGAPPFEVSSTNPLQAGVAMNPEAIAIADGCVFAGLQNSSVLRTGGQVQHVYKVDLSTRVATTITGTADVPGRQSQIATAGCRAAWLFDDGTLSGSDPVYKLHYYNGTSVITIDSATTFGFNIASIADGRLVYSKPVGGVNQVFVYDSTLPSPAPVQLTAYTSKTIDAPKTDGRHVGFLRSTTGNAGRHIHLLGGVQLTDGTNKPPDGGLFQQNLFFPTFFDRGRLVWLDATGALRFANSATVTPVALSPSTSVSRPWFADGMVAWLGTSSDGGTDIEVFRQSTAAGDAPGLLPAPWLLSAAPAPGGAILVWEQLLGATSYNIYLANQSGVTPGNYASLPGGRVVTGSTGSPRFLGGLYAGRTYYFVVTAVQGGTESAPSPQAQLTLSNGQWGGPLARTRDVAFRDVKSDTLNPSILYAAAGDSKGVWKSVDGGVNWVPLDGLINGQDVRAVAAHGSTVFAATLNERIYRSLDGGSVWTLVFTGVAVGEQQKALAIDPVTPTVVYAADFQVSGSPSNFVIKSVNNGTDWTQLTSSAGEIRAYALGIDSSNTSVLYAAGTGVPVSISTNGGADWSSVQPATGFFKTLSVAASFPSTIFTAGTAPSTASLGIYKGAHGSGSVVTWQSKNSGLPSGPLPTVYSVLADPNNPRTVHAGTDAGYYASVTGAESWAIGPAGAVASTSLTGINAMAVGRFNRLVAATGDGLYLRAVPQVRGDFNNDGKADIVLRNYSTGQNAIWLMNGTALVSIVDLPALPNTNYRIEGTADFNGDGGPDILLRNYATGSNALWILNGTALQSIVDLPALPNLNFRFEGTGDFDGNGSADIMIRNYSTGQNAVWLMNRTAFAGIVDLPALPATDYRFESAADMTGDGITDIVLRNQVNGANALWILNGTSLQAIVDLPALGNTNYRIDGVADMNGDSNPDIVLRNYSNGANAVWIMNGTALQSIFDLPALPNVNYEINGPR